MDVENLSKTEIAITLIKKLNELNISGFDDNLNSIAEAISNQKEYSTTINAKNNDTYVIERENNKITIKLKIILDERGVIDTSDRSFFNLVNNLGIDSVTLNSCSTGQDDEKGRSIARSFAEYVPGTVDAPFKPSNELRFNIVSDEKGPYVRFEEYVDGENITHRIDGTSRPVRKNPPAASGS